MQKSRGRICGWATLNQFLVQAALERANEVLEREQTIALSLESAEHLFRLLENPPDPNERLKEVIQRHEALLCR
jgi:uncharacterized protein (DUF1778 family)